MTAERTLTEAMGMDADEIAQLRAKADQLGQPRRCSHCHRPLPHTIAELHACPARRPTEEAPA